MCNETIITLRDKFQEACKTIDERLEEDLGYSQKIITLKTSQGMEINEESPLQFYSLMCVTAQTLAVNNSVLVIREVLEDMLEEYEKIESESNGEEAEPFIVHGGYMISNCGGYEVQISDFGESARLRDVWGSENPKVSDWLEIKYVVDEDWNGEDEDEEFHPVIDPEGYDIPLNLVMRADSY